MMRRSRQPIIPARAIQDRIQELAIEITRDFRETPLVVVPVLRGGVPFSVDLMRALPLDIMVEYIRAQSYDGDESTGKVHFLHEPEHSLEGQHVLVVEDVLDTGRTAAAILTRLRQHAPASLSMATLLDKPMRREVRVEADYVGFEIKNVFVVGYGLDYNERYRDLPAIYAMEEEG